jgi:translation initiation factor 2 subunit 1
VLTFPRLSRSDPHTSPSQRRLAPQPVKIRSDIEVTCFTYEGIDAIKDGLAEGEATGVREAPVVIKLIAPPMYVMTCVTLDKELGVETLTNAIEVITASVRSKG